MSPVKAFYTIHEIQGILDCSYTKAQDIAHMFIMQGQGIQHGRLIRVQMEAFDAWVNGKEQTEIA